MFIILKTYFKKCGFSTIKRLAQIYFQNFKLRYLQQWGRQRFKRYCCESGACPFLIRGSLEIVSSTPLSYKSTSVFCFVYQHLTASIFTVIGQETNCDTF